MHLSKKKSYLSEKLINHLYIIGMPVGVLIVQVSVVNLVSKLRNESVDFLWCQLSSVFITRSNFITILMF